MRENQKLIFISQEEYINEIFTRFNMSDCKPVKIPMEPGMKLTKEQQESDSPYREALGALMYLMISSRPDLAFVISYLSQYANCHGPTHWEAVKRVLRYLQGTKNRRVCLGGANQELKCFSDADWGHNEDRRSISGYAITFGSGTVSWSSRKQQCVAQSTTEAEYISVSEASKECIYLEQFLKEIHEWKQKSIEICCDNQSAIVWTNEGRNQNRSKHVDIRYHFIRDLAEQKRIKITFMPSEEMPADLMTKALPIPRFIKLVDRLLAATSGGVLTLDLRSV